MVKEIINISILSMLRIMSLALVPTGIIIGLFTFYITPTKTSRGLSSKAKLLSFFIFVVLWTVIALGGLTLICLFYNIASNWVNGIEIIFK